MSGYTRAVQYKESPYAKDLLKIMKAGSGPFTKKMLATELSKMHPRLSWQDIMNEVSAAIQMDRWSKKNWFKLVKHGWYDLA